MFSRFEIFDSHFHIIDYRFPLIENNGFLPHEFTCQDYLQRTNAYPLVGGAVVSGSFQGFDQSYLLDALSQLGPAYVGVTQLPASVTDDQIRELHKAGVRAVRFNLKRGGSETIQHLSTMAQRINALAGWHIELYVDSNALDELYSTLINLPSVSIDHLGLSQSGLNLLTKLVEKGVKVKATGFGRVDFDIPGALKDLYSVNPTALMFGTDLPSTRAPCPYTDNDINIVIDTLGEVGAKQVLSQNARDFYNKDTIGIQEEDEGIQ